MRVLLIDIGNSRVKWRFVDPRDDWAQHAKSKHPSSKHDGPQHEDVERTNTSGESGILALIDLPQLAQRLRAVHVPGLDAVHLSNVAGAEAEDALRRAVSASWGRVPVHALIPNAEQCGVRNGYRDPTQLGPDRWAAMLGAHALAPDRHLLVCSFGTATTIDLLLVEGHDHRDHRASFEGGLILPGFDAMRRSLARDTARLPMARGEVVDFAVGTDDAIASGIAAAQAGSVTHALRNARARAASRDRERGASRLLACVLAGGGANTMVAYLSDLDAPVYGVPDLVLRGLHAIARDRHPEDETRSAHNPTLARERS